MRKKLIALLLAAVTTVSLLSGCGADSGVMDTANANAVAGGNSNLPVVTWKMGSTWGAGNVHFTVDQRFGEILSQLTGGRFTVTNYSEASFAPPKSCLIMSVRAPFSAAATASTAGEGIATEHDPDGTKTFPEEAADIEHHRPSGFRRKHPL